MRDIRRLLALLLALALLFAGCERGGGAQPDGVEVFYPYGDEWQNGGRLIGSELRPKQAGGSELHSALGALDGAPSDGRLRPALTSDVSVLSYSVDGGEITLNMSAGYADLSGVGLAVAQACIVLTLCALDGINSVSIYIEDTPRALGLTAEGVLLENTETNPYEKQIKMYFADDSGRYLTVEQHSLTIGQDRELALYVMEELLHGPKSAELRSAIPQGTAIRSLTIENGVCVLDLSAEFIQNGPQNAVDERLTVYSIVNSLTSLAEINSVRFLINGAGRDKYLYLPLDEPVPFCESAVGAAEGLEDFTLYLGDSSGERLLALPVHASHDDYIELEATVMSALLSAEPEFGYTRLIAEDTECFAAVTHDSVCTVVLSDKFLESPDLYLAAQSVCATLTELDGVESVYISVRTDEPTPPGTVNTNISPDNTIIYR